MRLPRFITRTMSLAVLNDVASSVHRISSCASCPFARAGWCLHPTDNRINLNSIETLIDVHPECPLRGKPLLLQIKESENDNG